MSPASKMPELLKTGSRKLAPLLLQKFYTACFSTVTASFECPFAVFFFYSTCLRLGRFLPASVPSLLVSPFYSRKQSPETEGLLQGGPAFLSVPGFTLSGAHCLDPEGLESCVLRPVLFAGVEVRLWPPRTLNSACSGAVMNGGLCHGPL